jgi:hypothetical protein
MDTRIERRLKHIADILQREEISPNVIGIDGEMGRILFLFQYARQTGDDRIKIFAENLLDRINETIGEDTSAGYADGLIGFGTGIEYLVRHRFVDADTDDILEELDVLVHGMIESMHSFFFPERRGVEKYLTARLYNTSDKEISDCAARNRNSLALMLDHWEKPYNTYPEMITGIDFLSGIYPLNIQRKRVADYLNYAIDKTETMVYEDIHFGIYPGTFNPVALAVALIRAAEKTENSNDIDRARFFLENYEQAFRKHLDSRHALRWSLYYHLICKKIEQSDYVEMSGIWLDRFLSAEEKEVDTSQGLNGQAGTGLALLSLSDRCEADWMELITENEWRNG